MSQFICCRVKVTYCDQIMDEVKKRLELQNSSKLKDHLLELSAKNLTYPFSTIVLPKWTSAFNVIK